MGLQPEPRVARAIPRTVIMNYFYILQSEKDHKYYYGSTGDLNRRFREHTEGKVTSTKHRRPLNLVYYEAYQTMRQASARESMVKRSVSARRTLHKRIIGV